ncbi:MAG: helix-turn-helix transcriptional regulator [Polyangiaceae bacterium]|nr:helix-turn-helix transcriptional regulator [Polyangiaceae bacterium]
MGERSESIDLTVHVGARIQSLRLERDISLRKLAKMAKCNPLSISIIERGRSWIQLRMLRNIARALQVEPFDLFPP